MRKILVSVLLVSILVSVSSAQIFIGSKQAGMGGTGVASATGLSAVAFNPAGLMKGPGGEFLLSLGAASQGMNEIIQSLTAAGDPAQFMESNYATNLNANGNVYGILGLSMNKIGVSVIIPQLMASVNKPASSLSGTLTAQGVGGAVVTAGHTFGVPWLPASLDVGANAKVLTLARGNVTMTEPTVTTPTQTTTQTIIQGSGMGFDVGARTTFAIPMLTDFSVGIALRDLAQSFTYKPKTQTVTSTYNPTGDPTVTEGAQVEGTQTTATSPTQTAIGAAGTIPGIGLKVAADITSVSGGSGILAASSSTVTSLGIEYPLFMNALILRGGTSSGTGVSYTTVGAKINIPFLTLEVATVIDANNSANNAYVIDAGIAL